MKSEEIEIKKLSVKQYLTMIIPDLAELINKKKKNNELKIQLSMGVNFMHTTDRDKNRTFHVMIRMILLINSLNHF